ncbi:MAG TPA: hypothetical protein DEH22_15145 [Chloroflexi bacterium]|nr:hypothetical protein [Chloroflexota bacterium]
MMAKTIAVSEINKLQKRVAELEKDIGFQNIVQASPMGMHIYQLESDDRLVFMGSNPAADQILGVDHIQFIGKTIEEAFPPLAQTEIPERYRKAARDGESWKTLQISYEDHQIAGAYEVYAVQTAPGKMVAIFLEITERRRNELALQQRAAQLAILNKVGEQIAAVLDLENVFEKAVKLVQESFGYHHVGVFTLEDDEPFLVMQARAGGFDELMPPRHRLNINQGMVGWVFRNNQSLLSNDVTTAEQFINLYPDVMPTRSELCVPIHISDQVIGVLDAQSPEKNAFDESDVTVLQTLADQIAIAIENSRLHNAVQKELDERKRIESELRIQTTALESAANGIVITDHNGNIQWANPAFTQLTGYSAQEVIGISLKQISSENPDDKISNEIWSTIFAGEVWRGEISNRRKDQSLYTEEMTITPVKDTSDNLTHFIAIKQDITNRKMAEDALHTVVQGTSGATGEAFFRALVEYLSRALQVDYAFVGEYIQPDQIHSRALYAKGKIAENIEYALENTPCANVINQSACIYAENVQKIFPSDHLLAEMNIDGYAGVPLFDSTGNPLGVLVILNGSPIFNVELAISILQVFGTQASAELERMKVDVEMQKRANQLAALNQMGQMVTSFLDIKQVLEQVIHAFPPLVGADSVSVLLRDNTNQLVFAAASGESGQNLIGRAIPSDVGIAGMVLKNRKAFLVNNEEDQKLLYRNIESVSNFHTQSLLAVPLTLGGEIIGVMEAVHSQPNAFTEDDLQIIETAGSWASIAIGNARQHAATERQLKETEALVTINQALNETFDLDRLLQLIVDSISQIIPHIERAVFHLFDEDKAMLIPQAVSGIEPNKKPYLLMQGGQGIAGQVIETGLPINVADTRDDPRFIPIRGVTYLRSLLVVPVQSGGRRLGTISVSSTKPKTFTDEDEHLLTIIGVQAALALESARLFDETQQRAEHLELLNEITQAALQQPNLQTILQMLVTRLQNIFESDGCYINLWDTSRKVPVPVAAAGSSKDEFLNLVTEPDEVNITQSVLENGHAIAIEDTRQSEYISERTTTQFAKHSLLALPLIASDQPLGSVMVAFEEAHIFTPSEIELGESIAQQIALAISKARLLESEQQRRREAEILRDVTTTLTSTLEIDQVLTQILEQLSLAIHYDSASVYLIEGDQAHIVTAKGFEPSQLVIGLSLDVSKNLLFQEIRQTRRSIIIRDVRIESRWDTNIGFSPIRGWMGIPLIAQEKVIGFLTIDSYQTDAYTLADSDLAQAFANQAAVALQNARLFAATRRRLSESNTHYFISNLIVASSDLDVETILHQVVDLLWQEFGYYHVHIYLIDQTSGALIANQGSGPIGAKLKEMGYQFTTDEGIVGYAATIGEAFMTNNVAETHFFKEHLLLPDTCAELAAPLKARDQLLGVLDIQHKAPNSFDDDDFRFLVAVADQLAVVLDKALLYNQLQAALAKEQRTRDQLVQAEKLAAMGRLIASVAHELNNPLQAIQNALYLVKLEENLSTQANDDLQVAIDEGTRMAGLIARLRDTYRPTTTADFQLESINTLVDEVQKLIGTHLRHNNITLEFIPDLKSPPIRIIRDQIKQVILNLCINAIESMSGGGQLTIYSTYQTENDQIYLSVRDTGTGLHPEAQSRIFEPFFTTKEGGTGLGLAVSYEIAQNHGGLITAQNNDTGKGATFTLSLPHHQPMIE